MIHSLVETQRTPKWARYRCSICGENFRVSHGMEIPEGMMVCSPPTEEQLKANFLAFLSEEQKKDAERIEAERKIRPQMPSLLEQAKGLAKAASDWFKSGMQMAEMRERERRMEVCNACEFFDHGRCAKCGCFMVVKSTLGTSKCPIGKWESVPDFSKPVKDEEEWNYFFRVFPGYERTAHLSETVKTPLLTKPKKIKLYATICTWHDADIVAAAVKNCFAEGCDRVYIVDNDSPDDTVKEAIKAGAILAKTYKTAALQDVYRSILVGQLGREVTEAEAHDELWWLSLDVDEFPRGPGKYTIREFISLLPDECNTVGAFSFDHYPTDKIANVMGRHPADYQPYGWFRVQKDNAFCNASHWKHPLVRYKKGVFDGTLARGLHDVMCLPSRGVSVEHETSIFVHHFMYRNEDDTRRRLNALCGGSYRRSLIDEQTIGDEGAIRRYRLLDYVYSGQWDKVEMSHIQAHPDLKGAGVPLVHWSDKFLEEDYAPRRWY